MELDLQSFGSICKAVPYTEWLSFIPRNPLPPHVGSYEGAIGQPRSTTSFCDPPGYILYALSHKEKKD